METVHPTALTHESSAQRQYGHGGAHSGADYAPRVAAPAPREHSHVPVHYTNGAKLGSIIFVLVLAAALMVVFVLGQHSRHAADELLAAELGRTAGAALPVNVIHAKAAPVERLLTLPGEIRSLYETTIFARTSGYLSKWVVDIGDHVKAGQVLATIDTPELDDQMIAAKAKVGQLKAELQMAEAASQFAKVSSERWENMAPKGGVSKQERDQKKAELDASVAKVAAAKAQVDLADADIQRLNTLLAFRNVTAPFAGTITQRCVDVGALVTAGSTTNTTPLFMISQHDQVRVCVDVPQDAAGDVRVGTDSTLEVKTFTGRKFTGKVDRTSEAVDPASRTLKVQVLVPNEDHALRPGMYCQVTFQNPRQNPPVAIPAGALVLRTAGTQVGVVSADGRISFRNVKVARDLGDTVELASGVEPGEVVALNVASQVADGQVVSAHVTDAPGAGVMKPPVAEPANAASKAEANVSAAPAAKKI
jgi:RND family efflux transporter MFP subunit